MGGNGSEQFIPSITEWFDGDIITADTNISFDSMYLACYFVVGGANGYYLFFMFLEPEEIRGRLLSSTKCERRG